MCAVPVQIMTAKRTLRLCIKRLFCDALSDLKIITCLNPDCRKETCGSCRRESHITSRSDEIEKSPDVEIRTMI